MMIFDTSSLTGSGLLRRICASYEFAEIIPECGTRSAKNRGDKAGKRERKYRPLRMAYPIPASQAREHVRGLIEKIVLTPKEDREGLAIDPYGDLAGILKIATENKPMKLKETYKKARKDDC